MQKRKIGRPRKVDTTTTATTHTHTTTTKTHFSATELQSIVKYIRAGSPKTIAVTVASLV